MIARGTLIRFVMGLKGHKDQFAVKSALDSWFEEVRHVNWKNSADVKKSYAAASIVASDRLVFNI